MHHFLEASRRGVDRIQSILEAYSRGPGQQVNKAKSALFFSKNNTDVMKEQVHEGPSMPEFLTKALGGKYLGLPTALGRSAAGAFEHIPSKIRGLMEDCTSVR